MLPNPLRQAPDKGKNKAKADPAQGKTGRTATSAKPAAPAKNTPATQHNGLFLRVTIVKDGEPIVHNIARGGLLRVNAIPGANAPATKPAKPQSTPAKPAK